MSPELAKCLNEALGESPDNLDTFLAQSHAALALIRTDLAPSPLRRSEWLSGVTGGDVWLKLECLNPNGSFKVRGALNAISKRIERKRLERAASTVKGNTLTAFPQALKFVAASAGNHAQGVAFAARQRGCEAHIFCPKRTPLVKREATERLGAKLYLVGDTLEEAFEAAVAFAASENAEFLHAYNDYDVIVGQSTVAVETLEQLAQLQATKSGGAGKDVPLDFVCSVGGGGLAAGVGLVWRRCVPNGHVVGVEQESFDALAQSLQAGERLEAQLAPVGGRAQKQTLADGIAVKRIGNLTYSYMRETMNRCLLVDDDSITAAMLGLCEREHVVSEGAGAAAVAALLKNPSLFVGRQVVVCVSGGNVDPQILSRVITRGLGVTGRVLRVVVRIGDRPGQLKMLLETVAELDANVLEVYHDRTYSQVRVGDVEVELSLETRDSEHQYTLMERMSELGFSPKIPNLG